MINAHAVSSAASSTWRRGLTLATALLFVAPARTTAHDIPASVNILAFVRPEPGVLRLVVRVPLAAMRDVDFPLRGPGYLDVAKAYPLLKDAARLWIASYLELYEEGLRLSGESIVATQLSLPSDRSFAQYDSALAHVRGPAMPAQSEIFWQQAMLDVLIEYPIGNPRSHFSIHPALAHLGVRTSTVLRFQSLGGTERALQYPGDPGLVQLDPRWYQAAAQFVKSGFLHILSGIDHLLFVFCLVIPFRKPRPLIALVTSFTVAHSITLIASALGFAPDALWFPPLIEVLIALSIVYMAFENIVGANLRRRWIIAFGFGLVHGFGFSFVLRESLQFAGRHLATSLVSFNVGVELGQLFVLAVALPALAFLFRRVVAERIGTIILSALVAHTAWHWMTDRWRIFREYQISWPAFDLNLAVSILRGALVVAVLAAVVWGLSSLFGPLARGARGGEITEGGRGTGDGGRGTGEGQGLTR